MPCCFPLTPLSPSAQREAEQGILGSLSLPHPTPQKGFDSLDPLLLFPTMMQLLRNK